jgi:hypothetical protein
MATAGESLRGRISLIWPQYSDELLYSLTKVTETNEREIKKLVGLEFWGQREGAELHPLYPGESNSFNKKYIYGLISDHSDPYPPPPKPGEIPVGTIVSIKYPEEVRVYNSGFGGGKTIHAIPNRPYTEAQENVYGCLFEMAPELNVQMVVPEIPKDSGSYNVVLNKDAWGALKFEYKSPSPSPGPEVETINSRYEGIYDYYSAFKAEETLTETGVEGKDYNNLFTELRGHYAGLEKSGPIDPNSVRSPYEDDIIKIQNGELIYNVLKNGVGNITNLVKTVSDSENRINGLWRYGYDIYDMLGEEEYNLLVHMGYEVSYTYYLQEVSEGERIVNQLVCDYTITFRYNGAEYIPLSGTITFNYSVESEGEAAVDTVEFSGFSSDESGVDFAGFERIEFQGQVTITNAKWNLSLSNEDPMSDILTGAYPVFPLPKGAELKEGTGTLEIINDFYGWMFSNFAFYVEE